MKKLMGPGFAALAGIVLSVAASASARAEGVPTKVKLWSPKNPGK